MSRLVIKSHRPWQFATAIIILSMVIAVMTWLLLDSSHWSLINERFSGNRDTKALLEANQALTLKNKDLKDNILMLEQTTRLDKETASLLQEELVSLQDEISRLKRELEFYQVVMETARNTSGVDIHGLYVEPLVEENYYLIKLVLTNVVKSDRVIKGSLSINLEGMQGRNKRVLNLNELSVEPVELSFELKSFKSLEYRFELPPGFFAERVLVQINTGNRDDSAVSKTFDWPLNQ